MAFFDGGRTSCSNWAVTFFHVDRRGVLQAGQVIQPFPIGQACAQVSLLGTQVDTRALLTSWFPQGITNHGGAYIAAAWRGIPNQAIFAEQPLELIAELVRRLEFPAMPSRLQSLFACRSLSEAQAFRSRARAPHAKIFEVDSAVSFVGDMQLIHLGSSPASCLELVHKYWRGESSGSPTFEVLLGSPVRVLSVADAGTPPATQF